MFAITRQSFDNARSRNVIGAVGVDSKDAVTFSSRINELAIVVIACLDWLNVTVWLTLWSQCFRYTYRLEFTLFLAQRLCHVVAKYPSFLALSCTLMTNSTLQCNVSILQQYVRPFGNGHRFCLFMMCIRPRLPASFDSTLFTVGRLYNTRYKPLTDRTSTSLRCFTTIMKVKESVWIYARCSMFLY